MANICDYMKWRGDLTLQQSEFNEVDNLILSRFSYFPFDTLIKEDETVTIKELNQRFQKEDINKMTILWKDDVDLFPLMGNSKRFGDMLVSKYINKIDKEEEKQFAAITILMPDDTIYISYRGTDFTVVGWKEDLNMSFKSHVPSQKDSVKYLESIANMYPNQLRLGGHSKGGNLAVYAAVFADNKIKDRIINIYNNDGPGFNNEIIEMEEYKKIINKVHTFIPQSSIIGRLLFHEEDYTVIQSKQKGIMQHDLYSWKVIGNQFIHLKEFTNDSEIIDKTIKQWLIDVDAKQREEVIEILFDILSTIDIQNFSELKTNWFSNAKKLLKTYKNIDKESKKMISKTLNELFKIGRDNIFNTFNK